MPLPKIEHPTYEVYLKSLDRNVKFRPFLVKEEKILLVAKEAKDEASIKAAITQIIQNCLLEPVDVSNLPIFDIEMIFLKLRAKSVGESVRLTFNCQNEVDGVVCNADTDYVLNLEKVHYEVPEGHDPKIMINETIGVKLKYPTLAVEIETAEGEDEYTEFLAALISNIECIFDKDSVYKVNDVTTDELVEWFGELSLDTINRVKAFFASSPKVVLEDTVKCKKCGYEHTLHSENLLDFFL